MIAPATPQLTVQAVAELKKPRLTRIGIALPKADLGQGFPGPTAGESLQILVSRYLGGPNIEVVTLAALLGSQVEAEAKEKGLDKMPMSEINAAVAAIRRAEKKTTKGRAK